MLRTTTIGAVTLCLLAGCSDSPVTTTPGAADGGVAADGGPTADANAPVEAGPSDDRSVSGTWEKVEVKDKDGSPLSEIASVVVVSATEVYVASGSGNLGTGFYRFDGAAWASSYYSGFATSLRLLPSGELLAVGSNIFQKSASGNTWKQLATPDNAYVNDVWGESASSMFLSANTVYQRSGSSWKAAPGMPATIGGTFLGTKDGKTFFSGSKSWKTEFFRFDGTKWEDLKSTLPAEHQGGGTRGMFGTMSDDLWLVGSARKLLRFDGKAFSIVPGPDDEWGCDLSGGFATSKKNAWLYGASGCIFHWDGSAWTKTATGMTENIYALHASDPENVWAVPATKTHVLRLKPNK